MTCNCCCHTITLESCRPVIEWNNAPEVLYFCPTCLEQVMIQEAFILRWGRSNVASFASRLGSNKRLLEHFGFIAELNVLEAVCLGYRFIALAAVSLGMTAKDLVDQAKKQEWNCKIVVDGCCLPKHEYVTLS